MIVTISLLYFTKKTSYEGETITKIKNSWMINEYTGDFNNVVPSWPVYIIINKITPVNFKSI